MRLLIKNNFVSENRWILRMFVGFLKEEKLLYQYNFSFTEYSYLKFNENLNYVWFFENVLAFLYLFVIQKDDLSVYLYSGTIDHSLNNQLWRFYLLEHFNEIKFPKEINQIKYKGYLIHSIYKNGTYGNERLKKLFSKYKIKIEK